MRTAGGENRATTALIDAALIILAEQNPMTIRQLFYRLVSINVIPNDLSSYQRISQVMTKSRDDGRCPWEWIADRSRPVYQASGFLDAADFLYVMRQGYSKNHWNTQPARVEIWAEKDAVIGSIEETCKELNVTIRVCRGYQSTTNVHDIATSLNEIEKPIFALYLGDHDPSGQDMTRDIEARVRKYTTADVDLTVKRLAIFKEDIEAFELPPQPLKTKPDGTFSDSRTAGFRAAYGDETVEIDALPAPELRHRIDEEVKKHIDVRAWDESVAVEIKEKGRIADAFNQVASMTDDDAPTWAEFQSLREDYPRVWRAVVDVEAKKELDKHLMGLEGRLPSESLLEGLRAIRELLIESET